MRNWLGLQVVFSLSGPSRGFARCFSEMRYSVTRIVRSLGEKKNYYGKPKKQHFVLGENDMPALA